MRVKENAIKQRATKSKTKVCENKNVTTTTTTTTKQPAKQPIARLFNTSFVLVSSQSSSLVFRWPLKVKLWTHKKKSWKKKKPKTTKTTNELSRPASWLQLELQSLVSGLRSPVSSLSGAFGASRVIFRQKIAIATQWAPSRPVVRSAVASYCSAAWPSSWASRATRPRTFGCTTRDIWYFRWVWTNVATEELLAASCELRTGFWTQLVGVSTGKTTVHRPLSTVHRPLSTAQFGRRFSAPKCVRMFENEKWGGRACTPESVIHKRDSQVFA